MATNPSSKFTPFEIDINGTKITGIHYFPRPPLPTTPPSNCPLIILIHGGTCSAHNFDISPTLTASLAADFFSFPIISINRPGYLNSTPLRIPEGATYHQTLGKFTHEHLLPTLWRNYGLPQGCKAVIPMAHNLGSPGVFIAAGLHASETEPSYPLAGLIFSGWGIRPAPTPMPQPTDPAEIVTWKTLIMLGHPEHNCAPPNAYAAIAPSNQPMSPEETSEIYTGIWTGYWRAYADVIKVPIMCGVSEHDLFWEGTLEHLREIEGCFPRCARFDGSLVVGAPHAIEWSWMSRGWYARCFGFAEEVACAFVGRGRSEITRGMGGS